MENSSFEPAVTVIDIVKEKLSNGLLGFLIKNKYLVMILLLMFILAVLLIYFDPAYSLRKEATRFFLQLLFGGFVFFIIIYRYFEVEAIQRNLETKQHVTLGDYMWFRRSFDIPVIISVWVFLTVLVELAYSGGSSICLRSECFYNFYEIFKIPFLIIASGMALSGISAAAYRSIETSKQIKISETKNNFDIYTKHRELFFSDLDAIVSGSGDLFINLDFKLGLKKDFIYSLFFSDNTYSNFKDYHSTRSSNDIFKGYLDCFSSFAAGESIQQNEFNSVIDGLGVYLISTVDGSEVPYQKHRAKPPIMNFMNLLHKQLGEKYCRS